VVGISHGLSRRAPPPPRWRTSPRSSATTLPPDGVATRSRDCGASRGRSQHRHAASGVVATQARGFGPSGAASLPSARPAAGGCGGRDRPGRCRGGEGAGPLCAHREPPGRPLNDLPGTASNDLVMRSEGDVSAKSPATFEAPLKLICAVRLRPRTSGRTPCTQRLNRRYATGKSDVLSDKRRSKSALAGAGRGEGAGNP